MTFWKTVWAAALGVSIAVLFWQGMYALVRMSQPKPTPIRAVLMEIARRVVKETRGD